MYVATYVCMYVCMYVCSKVSKERDIVNILTLIKASKLERKNRSDQ